MESIDFLDSLKMRRWKIPSGEITNLFYLTKIAKLRKPVILSTGMSTIEDIIAAVSVLKKMAQVRLQYFTVLQSTQLHMKM